MLEVTISYDKLLRQLENVLYKNDLYCNDDVSLIVVRGYPINDYVPIIDVWFDDVINDRTIEILNEGDNQESLPLNIVYEELSEMNGKVITIDEGFDDLDLFVALNKNDEEDYNYYMMSVPFIEKIYPGFFDDDYYYDIFYDDKSEDEFESKAIDMCKYLDNVDNLVINENNHEIVFQLIKRLMRLMN